MSESIYEINRKHGESMYILGIEHALNILAISDTAANAIQHLKANVAARKAELEQPYHNRFDDDHRKWCDDCRRHYEDFIQSHEQE